MAAKTPQDSQLAESGNQTLKIENILQGLNTAQLHAVTSPASVIQILAPPGSGKTRTLTARVAYLLAHYGYDPSNVIVATFTVKASREMKERIGKLIGNGLERKLILGTFHSIARRYLVRYGHLIGVKKGFGIADSGDSASIIKRIVKRHQFNVDHGSARSRISNIKAQGMTYEEYIAKNEKAKKDVNAQEFVAIYREYQEHLEQANLLDYDDLLLKCVDLLRAYPECVKNVEAVLVDEFQDTNLVQFDLMRGFAKWQKRVTIVGDPDQSIYGFRAAEIKNLKRMRTAYPETLVVILEENYRSSASILHCAQVVIEQDESRPNKVLLPTHSVGTRPVLRHLRDASQEAQWIVVELKRIMALTGNMIVPSDFAILVRSASLTRNIEAALAQHGMPYKMVGGHRFYDRVEVKNILDYLRVIQNPGNDDALARVVNVPPRKVGDVTVKALMEEAHQKKRSLWDLIKGGVRGELKLNTNVTKTAEQGLATFVNVILTARKMLLEQEEREGEGGLEFTNDPDVTEAATGTIVDIVYYLMKKLSYRKFLEKNYPEDYESRWANIEELVVQASEFTNALALSSNEDEEALPVIDGLEQQKPSAMADALDRFLANVALASDVQQEADGVPREQITISTIHAAKGLEWPVVFIPGCYEGSIPHSRSEDMDEERRLLYVAMTRAMGLLYMSCPKKNSKHEKSALSQFVNFPNVLQLLDKTGPSLTLSKMQCILQILGRECPELAVVQREAEKLESVEDDLIPVGSSESDDEDEERVYKKRRIESNDYEGGMQKAYELENGRMGFTKPPGWNNGFSSYNTTNSGGGFMSARSITTSYAAASTSMTTMSTISNFSVNMTSMASLSGFKSARWHMDDLRQQQLEAEVDIHRRDMHRIHPTDGAGERAGGSLQKKAERKKIGREPPKTMGGKTGTGSVQGNLLGFLRKPLDGASGGVEAGRNLARQQAALKSVKEERYVYLSSSPIRTRKSPSPQTAQTQLPINIAEVIDLMDSPVQYADPDVLLLSEPSLPPLIKSQECIPGSDGEDELPSVLPHPYPELQPAKAVIPDSDTPDDDLINSDEEEAYREIEALDSQRYEPVRPKPLLARAELSTAVGLGGANVKVRLVDSALRPPGQYVIPGTTMAPIFNPNAIRTGVGVSKPTPQPRKTLGIRRSMNGWENRASASSSSTSTSKTSARKTSSSRGKGKGFIHGLLG